jgi:hypothetical protein
MAVHLNILSRFQDKGLTNAQKSLKRFTGGLKGIAGALGVGLGLSALANGLREVGQAASEDIKSQALLATQLRNTTGATDEQVAGIEKVINAMQMEVGVFDDELRPAMATLVRATGETTQAQRLLALSADIAAGTGKDLGAVSVAVAKAVTGQTTALTRLVPSLRNATDWAAAAEKEFGGMAETAKNNDPFKMMSIIFGEMQEQIGMKLIPYLQKMVAYLESPEGAKQLDKIVTALANGVMFAANLAAAFVDNAEAIGQVTIVAGALTIGLGLLTAASTLAAAETITLSLALKTLKWAMASTGIGLLIVGLGTIASAFGEAADKTNAAADANNNYTASLPNAGFGQIPASPTTDSRPNNPKPGQVYTYFNYDKNGQAVWWETTWNGKSWTTPKRVVYSKPTTQTKANPISEFANKISADIAKVNAATKLAAMGASQGLVEAIVGSGDQWQVVYNDIVKRGDGAVTALQAKFNKTQAGIDELATAQEEAYKKTQEAIEAAADALQDYIDLQNAATAAINESLTAVRNLGAAAVELGEFEQQVADAFTSLGEQLRDALDSGAILDSAYTDLTRYANAEQRVLQTIGRQRDELATKKSLVESIMGDVRDAIGGVADINNYVTSQTQTITEATSRLVNGLQVTTTRTLDVIKTQNTIVAGFQGVLDKAKTFVANLKQLRALGLSTDLFKQIVSAGADAGNATAEALISGGAGTISEVNQLYKDIQDTAGQAAEDTAQYLYGQGLNLTDGIIAGISAKEAELTALAGDLGQKFADAFASKVGTAIAAALDAYRTLNPDPSIAESDLSASTGGGGRGISFNAARVLPTTSSQLPIQLTLNLDSRQVAQGLIKLEKTSGNIWVRAAQ